MFIWPSTENDKNRVNGYGLLVKLKQRWRSTVMMTANFTKKPSVVIYHLISLYAFVFCLNGKLFRVHTTSNFHSHFFRLSFGQYILRVFSQKINNKEFTTLSRSLFMQSQCKYGTEMRKRKFFFSNGIKLSLSYRLHHCYWHKNVSDLRR